MKTLRIILAVLSAVLAVLMADPVHARQAGSWSPASSLGLARQEHGAARIGDEVYVVGGLVIPFSSTNQVEVLDLGTGLWSAAAPLPVAADHVAVAAVGGKLYVAGGFGASFQVFDDLWIYDLSLIHI